MLGDLRDNAVTFLLPKPDRRDQLPNVLAWTDATSAQQSTPLPGGGFGLQHCAALPRFVISRPVTGRGDVEAIAGGETPNAALDALAVQVRRTARGICPTIGVAAPGGLGRHVATYCVGKPTRGGRRFVVRARRPVPLGHRALLTGWADPAIVRWIDIETNGSSFLVRPSRSGAFFVAYPDAQPGGRRWRMRAALRGHTPIRFTAFQDMTLGPSLPAISHTGLGRARTSAVPSGPGQSAETQGRKLGRQAISDTATLAACVIAKPMARPTLQDAKPLSAITDVLPLLGTPSSSRDQRRALALLPPGATARPVLGRTLRTVALHHGVRLLVYVQVGGPDTVEDPAGCGRARRRRAAQLYRGRPLAVQAWAVRRLAQMRDGVPGLQTLWISVQTADRPSGMFGGGSPVIPGQALRPGLRVSGGANGRSVYIGIAGKRTTRVLIRPRRPTGIDLPASVDVVHGFYGVVLPKATGPVDLREVAADGTVLRSIGLRN